MNHHTLLLSPHFFPEPIGSGRYNGHLAQFLRDAGCRVSVACSHPVYPDWQVHETQQELPAVNAHRGGRFVRYPSGALMRRMVLEGWFALHALQVVLALRSRIDSAVAVFPPSLFWALAVSLIPSGVRTVGIVHDLQGTYAKRMSSRLAGWMRVALLRVERRAFHRCEMLVFMSHAMREVAMREYGLPPDKCIVAYPPATVCESGPAHAVPAPLLDGSVRHVVYSGALGIKQNPEGLVAMLSAMGAARRDVRCHVFSRGPVFEQLRRAHAGDGLVHFHDLVADDELAGMYERSAVQVVAEEPGASLGSLPSKLANILWMGVPVFCVTDSGSELGRLVTSSGIGTVDDSFGLQHQVRTLSELVDRSARWDRQASKRRVRDLLGSHFSFERIRCVLQP
jgi:colanic acid biosynthesis glycosyl transferase WcaI